MNKAAGMKILVARVQALEDEKRQSEQLEARRELVFVAGRT